MFFPYLVGALLLAIVLYLAFKPRRRGPGIVRDLQPGPVGHTKYYRRPVSKSPVFGAPYKGTPPYHRRPIFLTPRQVEHVNIQRRMRGVAPLNRDGFKNAVAHAWDQPRRQPDTSNDWLTYLVLYNCFLEDHQSPRVGGVGGLTIDPNAPYNGQGGEFAGAGASGDWSGPGASLTAAALSSRMGEDSGMHRLIAERER